MRQRVLLLAVLLSLAAGLTACGSSGSSTTQPASTPTQATTTTASVSNTKAKFVAHAGLALGAIYQWIYKPAKAGELTHPLQHKFTAIKAALAGAFAYHELGQALTAAQADATLSKLAAPITSLQNKIKGVADKVKSAGASTVDASSLNSTISSIKDQAASAGAAITQKIPSTPAG